jgi:hypothetical protein
LSLSLAGAEPFAVGGRRVLYVHPDDPERCVKVLLPGRQPDRLRREARGLRRLHRSAHYDENLQDLLAYRQLWNRHGEALHAYLPTVFGTVETDIGPGLVVQLIRDGDGRISLSGKGYTIAHGLSQALLEAVDVLEAFLVAHRVRFRDPFPHNLAVRQADDGRLQLFIVDGLARRDWLPASLRPGVVARIRRQVARLRRGFERTEFNRVAGVTPKTKGLLLRR